jgi:UDP-N-acetylglucosamine 4,6-dehydratase/5-epimerase
LNKKTILITGGTGFIGKRLGLALQSDYRVILAGRNNKLAKQAQDFTGCDALPLDITNIESVRDIVVSTRPNIIIHAAATKFVDNAERQPMECIDVNILGSQNVARVAMERGVETVIGTSTDKASPPVRNTYGMSKAMMERIFCSCNGMTETKFICVRFGNVVWSSGSVFPLWRNMQERTGSIGTTGPEMRRFFFTVDESVELVLEALKDKDRFQGKVLSRKMKAAQIADILRVWVEHKGGTWKRISGRPGEREDEFLIGDAEIPHTSELELGGVTHYLLSFNEKAETPVSCGLSSRNADRLTDAEILDLISNPPMEETGNVWHEYAMHS